MNPLWLLLIIPGYMVAAGFSGNHVHRKDWHCCKTDPLCALAGLFWPAAIIFAVLWYCLCLGMRLESRLPSSRREAGSGENP